MAYAIKGFNTAIASGDLLHDGNEHLTRHVGNAVRKTLRLRDEDGQPLWTIYKERPESPHKIDGAMAAILSWEARTDAVAAGAGGHAGEDPGPGIAGRDRRGESRNRAHHHHAFHAEIQHARLLRDQLAERGIDERRAGRDGRGHDRDQRLAHGAVGAVTAATGAGWRTARRR